MISVIVTLLPPREDPQLAHRVISQREENALLRREIFLSGAHTGMGDLIQTYINYPYAWTLSWRQIGENESSRTMNLSRKRQIWCMRCAPTPTCRTPLESGERELFRSAETSKPAGFVPEI